jgi:hypothetical protein
MITRRVFVQGLAGSLAIPSSLFAKSNTSYQEAIRDHTKRLAHIKQTIDSLLPFSGEPGLPVINKDWILDIAYFNTYQDQLDFVDAKVVPGSKTSVHLKKQGFFLQTFPTKRLGSKYSGVAPARDVRCKSLLLVRDGAYGVISEEGFAATLMHELAHVEELWNGRLQFTNKFTMYDLLDINLPEEDFEYPLAEFNGHLVGYRFGKRFGADRYQINTLADKCIRHGQKFLSEYQTLEETQPNSVPPLLKTMVKEVKKVMG